ncbi:MAG: hypothetical protein WAM28_01565 [Chlamydiales bacterium]
MRANKLFQDGVAYHFTVIRHEIDHPLLEATADDDLENNKKFDWLAEE